jgi:DNA-binding NarL/FixJ family response regulator
MAIPSDPHQGPPPARLVIAEEHPLALAGLRAMLAGEPDFEIVGEAATGQEAASLCQRMHPDLMLLNLRLPDDTLQAIAAIAQVCPWMRILIYVIHAEPEHLVQAQHAGAAGYLLKEASQQEVVTALRRVLQGETLF